MSEKSGFAEQMPAAIGRYQVQGSIGYGAMGAVYKAFDPLIKRTLAIKTIRLDIPRQSPQYKSFIERFYHEARISGTLSHPNIVTLFDIGEEGGIPYLAMEFVEGDTLSSLLEKGLRFPPEKVIGLISQVASAVDYAHSRGVIHRDIKPSNLILFEGDRVKVTDFGIAKLVDSEMTQAGTLLGTPSYMSPEQAMGDKLDGRSDIFSLGVCAFEMLSGEQPFPGANVTSILYKLVHVDPIQPPNLEMNGLVPQKWHDVFGRVLAKKPDERYQTASEFVQDLEYCLGSWFGAAMADAPLGETAPLGLMSPAGTPSASAQLGGASESLPEATTSFPALTLSGTSSPTIEAPALAGPLPQAPPMASSAGPLPSEEGDDELPATIHMKAPPVTDVAGATIRMPSSEVPKPPEPAPTVKTNVRSGAETVKQPPPEATVVSRAPAPPPSTPAPPAARPAAPPRGGMPSGLVLGGLALLVLAVAALAIWGVMGRRSPEPSPPPTLAPTAAATPEPPPQTPPPVVLGSLHVESQPPGAQITVNGEAKGPAPVDVASLAVGNYEVRAELKGYEPRSETVAITQDAMDAQLKLVLVRVAPTLGLVDIASTPSGAAVSVDDAPVGVTPLTSLKLRPGSHQVNFTKEGYDPRSESVRVEAGKRARLDVPLTAIVKATPTPTPTPVVVDANTIYENTARDVDTLAKKVSGSSASYPKKAPGLDRDSQVSVSVNFIVNENGEVVDPKVTESAGKLIDDSVLEAIRTWRYEPAVKQGVKVKVRVRFKQTFRR